MTADQDPIDETKRKFAEALAAKKARQGSDNIDEHARDQVQTHGPVDAKRMYRRKTG